MNSRQMGALKNQFLYILRNLQTPGNQGRKTTKVMLLNDFGFALIDDVANQYDSLIKELLNYSDWGDKFSEKYIESKVGSIISEGHKSSDAAKSIEILLASLVDELDNYNREHVVIVPISGIRMDLDELQLGNILLYTLTSERGMEISERLERIILSTANCDRDKEY